MIKAVFFDLNGVLIESEYLSQRFEARYGVPNDTFVQALGGVMDTARRPEAPAVYDLFKPHFTRWGVELTEADFLDFWFSGEQVNQAALAYVAELAERGIAVYVLSNNFRERTEFYRTQFPDIFSKVTKAYFSWETGLVKPDPAALKLILNENTLSPKQVVYFDDSDANIEMAKACGVDAQKWESLEAGKAYLDKMYTR